MQDPPPDNDGGYGYLMQFTDGNRIDLGLCPLEKAREAVEDSLSVLLLDKDGLIGALPPPGDKDYLPQPPTAKAFSDCCNEFWWVCPYVAKGLWRRELPYARYMLDQVLREPLMKMLRWHIGLQTRFAVNPGKFGKYFQKYLEPHLWGLLLETYADANYDHAWAALENMGALFRTIAIPLAQHFGFDYPQGDDERISAHLRHVRTLPRDAEEMY
jgi:aminoglycoside 6-adenylyltransferase